MERGRSRRSARRRNASPAIKRSPERWVNPGPPLTPCRTAPILRIDMRMSQLFGKTLRQAPAEAEIPSHQLLLRAGLVHQIAAGVLPFPPLAWRALQRVEGIIREEMDAAGGQELMMPSIHPIEIWQGGGAAPHPTDSH